MGKVPLRKLWLPILKLTIVVLKPGIAQWDSSASGRLMGTLLKVEECVVSDECYIEPVSPKGRLAG